MQQITDDVRHGRPHRRRARTRSPQRTSPSHYRALPCTSHRRARPVLQRARGPPGGREPKNRCDVRVSGEIQVPRTPPTAVAADVITLPSEVRGSPRAASVGGSGVCVYRRKSSVAFGVRSGPCKLQSYGSGVLCHFLLA
jgi:hypothetical protein